MMALIILAAGESSRMSFPKALLKIGGETFLECIQRKAIAAGIEWMIVITGPDHETIVRKLPSGIRCVKNENYMQGQISSLRKGILTVKDTASALIVWPVDQPIVKIETVTKLISTHESENKALTIPCYQSRKGHPVIYNGQVMQAALDLQPQQTGKDLQMLFAENSVFVDVDDPGVVIDIDTPEDYRKHISGL